MSRMTRTTSMVIVLIGILISGGYARAAEAEKKPEKPAAEPGLIKQIAEQKKQLAEQQKQLAALEKRLSQLEKAEAQSTKLHQQLQATVGAMQKKLEELGKTLPQVTKQSEETHKQLQALSKRVTALEPLAQRLKQLEAALPKQRQELSGLGKQFAQLEKQFAALQAELGKLQKALPAAEGRVAKVEKQLGALQQAIAGIRHAQLPVGTVALWAGAPNTIPADWEICDGKPPTTAGATFKGNKPNLLDRFVKGARDGAPKLQAGGSNSVQLSADHLPAHAHRYDDVFVAQYPEEDTQIKMVDVPLGYGVRERLDLDNKGWARTATTTPAGGGKAFDNRPAYQEMIFIIKVK